jgi:hypothetical protein
MATSDNAVALSGTRTLAAWEPEGKVAAGFGVHEVVVGRDDAQLALEVVVLAAGATASLSRESLGSFHTARIGRRVSPVVVLAARSGQAWLFGPNPQASVIGPLPLDQAQRMVQTALDEPSGLAARQRLAGMFSAIEGTKPGTETDYLPGVANAGLFATHELRHGVRLRGDWSGSCETAEPLLRLRREALIEALGYSAQSIAAHALILYADGVSSRAVAVLLDENESFDGGSSRFSVSPVAYAVSVAQKHELSWVMILRGSQLRLYPARAELGVGRKGLAETYFEIDLALVTSETSGLLPLVFSAPALAPKGSTAEILASSAQYAVALGARLRDQVYEQIVPRLSLAIAPQLPALGHPLDRKGLDLAYQLTLRVFFRLLFQAYAEDRKLLPFGENPRYDRNALNTLASDLAGDPGQVFDANSASMWDDLAQMWHVIDKGDASWSVPAYNGGLFGCDPELQREGELLERISVTNDVMGPVLQAMLIDTAEDVTGPIDFRSLSVREFGTIYEGLLESNLAIADTDLVLDDNATWVPAQEDDYPLDLERSAPAGNVYFHNTSGQRKGTGSYFTPSFVVEHLLVRALDPTLEEHLARVKEKLEAGDQPGAADLFFDFRVADLAMGSGHFLTAAIDHLEAAMAAFLAENPIPGVTNELRHLEQAARDATGPDVLEPEPSSLLRRQIARRCIYGLDINPIAVELARVSIWIHTFVRGLPMSSLDHNLVCANSLTGIGTVDEALDALVPERTRGVTGTTTIFDAPIQEALDRAKTTLVDISNAAEATRKEAQDAARGSRQAQAEASEAKLLFDAAVLGRIGKGALVAAVDPAEIALLASRPTAQDALAGLAPAHMPVLFPEVFLRAGGGFDVLIGNPPWEEAMVEEPKFWLRVAPGLLGLRPAQLKARIVALRVERADLLPELEAETVAAADLRRVLLAGPYPGLGTGDVDLYRVFAWRNWHLIRSGGRIGVVLPRNALNGLGMQLWRKEVLTNGGFPNVCLLANRRHWVFEGVHEQNPLIALTVLDRDRRGGVAFCGPFYSREEWELGRDSMVTAAADEFESWTTTAAFPLIPDALAGEVFARMREHPRFDARTTAWDFRPISEFHATNDRPTFDAGEQQVGRWPVLGGSSFNLWEPETGQVYTWADPERVVAALQQKRLHQARLSNSAFFGLDSKITADPKTLPCYGPRIVFRDVTNGTNTRTVIAALVPGERILTNKAPYLFRASGDEADEAYLLGVLCSIPLDWYARRFVELGLNLHILSGLPIPQPPRESPIRNRVIEIAGRLAARDDRFTQWADAVGVAVGSVADRTEEADLVAELDALVARLYGLSRDQLEHVFATFHRGWDFEPRLESALLYFDTQERAA